MSRKKSLPDKIICENIKKLRERTGLTGIKFAENIGISQSYLSELENHISKPNKTLLLAISYIYNTPIEWLLSGEGEMFREPEKNGFGIAENGILYNKVEKPLDEDLDISALLNMTKDVLKSKTDYAASLAANIHSFFRSINLEKRVSAVESELSKIKKRVDCCPTGSPESILEKKM